MPELAPFILLATFLTHDNNFHLYLSRECEKRALHHRARVPRGCRISRPGGIRAAPAEGAETQPAPKPPCGHLRSPPAARSWGSPWREIGLPHVRPAGGFVGGGLGQGKLGKPWLLEPRHRSPGTSLLVGQTSVLLLFHLGQNFTVDNSCI